MTRRGEGASEDADPSSTPPRRVTIFDIAQRAGVSPSTVSNALNGRPGVGEVARGRIIAIASDLGWRPNNSARALRAARSRTVGMVLQHRGTPLAEMRSPFLLNLITGIDRTLSLDGFALLLRTVPDLVTEVEVYRQWWVEQRVDGVIVYNPNVEDPRLQELRRLALPAVVMGRLPASRALATVWSDNHRAAGLAVDHLIQGGHRRIARVGLDPSRRYVLERRRGFEEAMARADLPGDLSLAATADAGEATLGLLERRDPPTAIIFEADTLAIEGMLALRARGVGIPDEVSVLAWDDCRIYELFSPPLTALHRDVPELGHIIAKALLGCLSGEPPTQVRGPVSQLEIRGSTASPGPRRSN